MPGDHFVGDFQRVAAFQSAFLQKEGCKALVKALPEHLLHEPHDLRQAAGHDLAGIVGKGSGVLHDPLVNLGRYDQKIGVLFRFDGEFKLNAGHHAGGGEQADIHVEKTVDGDLPALP